MRKGTCFITVETRDLSNSVLIRTPEMTTQDREPEFEVQERGPEMEVRN